MTIAELQAENKDLNQRILSIEATVDALKLKRRRNDKEIAKILKRGSECDYIKFSELRIDAKFYIKYLHYYILFKKTDWSEGECLITNSNSTYERSKYYKIHAGTKVLKSLNEYQKTKVI